MRMFSKGSLHGNVTMKKDEHYRICFVVLHKSEIIESEIQKASEHS